MIDGEGVMRVAAPGTLVRLTTPQPNPAQHFGIHALMVQVVPGNLGKIYVGKIGMDKATLSKVWAILMPPAQSFLPTFSVSVTIAPNGLAMEDFYMDADNPGEGALVTFLQS